MIYLKISKNNKFFIFGIEGLDEDELLNLVKQSMDLGYKVESSSEKEKQILTKNFLTLSKMDEMYEEWDKLINWNKITNI